MQWPDKKSRFYPQINFYRPIEVGKSVREASASTLSRVEFCETRAFMALPFFPQKFLVYVDDIGVPTEMLLLLLNSRAGVCPVQSGYK